MNVENFCATLSPTSTLAKLLAGEIPDVEIPLVATDRLQQSLQRALDTWEFVGPWFRSGSLHRAFRPCIMPIAAYLTLRCGVVPGLDTLTQFVRCSPILTTWDCEGRVYQCWTAWLRELDLGLKLASFGAVVKNPLLDVGHGVDWVFRRDGLETRIAVAHAGDWHLERKQKKVGEDVVTLYARGGAGVHLVDTASIPDRILHNASASSSI